MTSSTARTSPGSPAPSSPPSRSIPEIPSCDIAWVPKMDQGPVLASVDAHDNKISLYCLPRRWLRAGKPSGTRAFCLCRSSRPDLNGDGLTELVVRNAGDGTLSVFFGTEFVGPINPKFAAPQFSPPVTIPVGLGVSDVEVVDTTGSGRLDLVVTEQADRPGEHLESRFCLQNLDLN